MKIKQAREAVEKILESDPEQRKRPSRSVMYSPSPGMEALKLAEFVNGELSRAGTAMRVEYDQETMCFVVYNPTKESLPTLRDVHDTLSLRQRP